MSKRVTWLILFVLVLSSVVTVWSASQFRDVYHARLNSEIRGIGEANAKALNFWIDSHVSAAATPQNTAEFAPVADLINEVSFKRLGHSFLIDSNQVIIASPIPQLIGQSLADEFGAIKPKSGSLVPVQSSIGARSLRFFPVNGPAQAQWYLVADLNRGELQDSPRFVLIALATALVAGCCLGMLLVLMLRRR